LIHFTHDIDWINPAHVFAWIKCISQHKYWVNPRHLLNKNLFVNNIANVCKINESNQINATWFIGAQHQNQYKRFGLRYTVHDKLYQNIIELLAQYNADVGLHSVKYESIQNQLQLLQTYYKKTITKHRSHYLKYNHKTLSEDLAQTTIKTDFTLGSARQITLAPSNNNLGIRQTPTVLFDNVFFFKNPDLIFQELKSTLDLAASKKQEVAICFHPENFLILPEMQAHYQRVILLAKEYPTLF